MGNYLRPEVSLLFSLLLLELFLQFQHNFFSLHLCVLIAFGNVAN